MFFIYLLYQNRGGVKKNHMIFTKKSKKGICILIER